MTTQGILGIAVVIPAHDEAATIARCVRSVLTAAADVAVPVTVVVALDACTDGSAAVLDEFGADVLAVEVDVRCVGAARAAGFRRARENYQQRGWGDAQVWFATTDADSTVDRSWLRRQLDADADVVLGVVRIRDRRRMPAEVLRRYLAAYRAKFRADGRGHDHVHGANMGFRADAYWNVGGFAALPVHEDVDLVHRFDAVGARIARTVDIAVATSARPVGRAAGGFATHLQSLERPAEEEPA